MYIPILLVGEIVDLCASLVTKHVSPTMGDLLLQNVCVYRLVNKKWFA